MTALPTPASRLRPETGWVVARVALLVFFAWLAGRHWHPHYGFTRFLQMDRVALAEALPELRPAPIFTYADGYDGHYYAQLAARPAVNDPAMAGGFDNLGYRARRILLSWAAWAVGGGDAVAAVRAYAWLNLAVWAALAAMLWRLFPATGWRETLAWGGVLFSAGVLHSVRQALTDQLALLLVAGAALAAERGRGGWAAGLLGLGALARETALLGAAALFSPGRAIFADWRRAAGWAALAVAPLALWMWYLHARLGPIDQGGANFTLPLAGWVGKWREVVRLLRTEPDHYLALTTLLALVGLTAQAAWLLVRRQPADRWWRMGAAYAALMLVLGGAVWDGHPGAATRVLLPLALAFNVLAVRARVAAAWLVLGNLSVLSGVLALWNVPPGEHEVAAGRGNSGSYVAHVGTGWYPLERNQKQTWAWAAEKAELSVETQPARDDARPVLLGLRAISPRPLEIRQGGRVVWRGELAEKLQWIGLPAVEFRGGRAELELRSDVPPAREGAASGRALGFAVYGVRLD